MKRLTVFCLLFSVFCLLSQTASAEQARCLFAKGGYVEGTVSMQGKNLSVVSGEEKKTHSLSDMIFVKFPAPYNPSIVEEGIVLTNGNIITGAVEILEKRTVRITSDVLGKQIVKEESIARVILTAQRIFDIRKGFDESQGLLLKNGDRMPGTIKWISEKTIAIEAIIGLIDVPRQNIAVLNFRAVNRKTAGAPFRVKCKNGDILTGDVTSLSNETALLNHTVFGKVSLKTSYIKEIRAKSIRADHLTLAGNEQVKKTPYFDSIRNIRKDRSYRDEYLGIDGEGYDRGIIAMSRTTLTYNLRSAYRAFYAELGIDESVGPKGSVHFSIKVDGQTVYESPETVTGTMDPIPVLIKLENSKKLEITIDFAEGGSVADFAVLGDTLLIR